VTGSGSFARGECAGDEARGGVGAALHNDRADRAGGADDDAVRRISGEREEGGLGVVLEGVDLGGVGAQAIEDAGRRTVPDAQPDDFRRRAVEEAALVKVASSFDAMAKPLARA
jgi:hypothetical protein